MRIAALAAAALAAFTLSAAANTPTWTDQAMRLVLTTPDGWTVDQRAGLGVAHEDTATVVVVGDGQHQCQMIAGDNMQTAADAPSVVYQRTRDASRFTPQVWASALNQFSDIFPNNSAQVQATSIDTTNFWPIQRAEAQSPRGHVLAAIQQRPGVDIVTACVVSNPAEAPIYEQIIRSVGHPSDAILQSAVESELQNQSSAH